MLFSWLRLRSSGLMKKYQHKFLVTTIPAGQVGALEAEIYNLITREVEKKERERHTHTMCCTTNFLISDTLLPAYCVRQEGKAVKSK